MADEIIRLDYSAEDIGDNIDEVRTARGEYDSLDERLDEIEGGGFTPTQAQLDAINSGITDDDVEQIDLNKNNILTLEQANGAKNLYKFEDLGATAGSGTGVTLTDNGDGTFSATGTASGANYARYLLKQAPIKAGIYIISGISGGALESYRLRVGTGSGDAYIVNLENNYAQFTIATDTTITVQFVVNSGVTVTNLSIKPMIITKAMYDAGFTDYQPYALSNADLTEGVLKLQERFINCQFIASRADYTEHTFTVKRSSTLGRYHYGIFMVGTPATYGIYKIFYDDANTPASATVEKILGNSALTYTASITWNGLVGTLTITGSDRAYGGIRGIWFD